MVEYIVKNKEWIFSGAGISVIAGMFVLFQKITRQLKIIKRLSTTISVESFRDFTGYNDNSDKSELLLEYKLIDGTKIQPHIPYLEKIRREKRIEGNYYVNTPFCMTLPTLIVDVVNENDIPILIESFNFGVFESVKILVPIPVFHIKPDPFHILIENQGTSPMQNVRLSFYVSIKDEVENKELEHSFNYDSIADFKSIDISDHLASQGVDTRYLSEYALYDFMSARDIFNSEKDEKKKEEAKADYSKKIATALGPYGDLIGPLLAVHGKLSYETNGKKVSLPFTTYTWIRMNPQAPPPLSASYDVEFKVTSNAYDISFPSIHELKAKSAHRFSFNLSSACWSRYDFSLKMLTNHGVNKIHDNFQLEVFLSRASLDIETTPNVGNHGVNQLEMAEKK